MRDFVPIFAFVFLPFSTGHVALTFPEARFPPLDFLDTSRTMGPCGVPKPGNAYFTTLVVGNTYNFTWRMQYPHQGGFKLSLIDSKGDLVERLSPMNGLEYAGLADQTIQFERVQFTKPCLDCTIVLERQALEWGKSYKFRSCADVNVLEKAEESEEFICNGRGRMENGQCDCEEGYTGDICQYLAHCHRDSDCQNGGSCVMEPNSLIQKKCYCAYGFFGNNCKQRFNQANDECFAYETRDETGYDRYGMFNLRCYNKEKLNERNFVYYRKIKSDIEVILDFETTSWISLGWRPQELDPSCRLFPDLEGATTRSKRGATEQETEGEAVSRPIMKEDVLPPTKVAQEGPRPAMPKNNGLLDSALHAPLHAMDCIDVIMAAVKNGRLKIRDMYSRDRSTPLEDAWYEGEMSLVAASGVEVDGRTIVMFRRMMQEIEPSDHPLGPGRQFVVWAAGQTQGAYSHSAPSALESSHGSDGFYLDDVAKYHGSKNRGVHPIDFTSPVKMVQHNNDSGITIAQSGVHPSTPNEKATSKFRSNAESEPEPDSSAYLQEFLFVILIALFVLF